MSLLEDRLERREKLLVEAAEVRIAIISYREDVAYAEGLVEERETHLSKIEAGIARLEEKIEARSVLEPEAVRRLLSGGPA